MNLRRVRGVFKRHYHAMTHNPPAYFDMLFWPFLDLVVWGLLTVFIQRQADLPRAVVPIGFLLGGVLLWDLLFRSGNGVAVAFLDDTSWTHNIINLLASPLRPSEYVAGIVAFSFAKVLAAWALMLLLAWLMFQFAFLQVGVVIVVFVLALMVFGVALSQVILGLSLRFGPGADILAWGLIFMLLPLSAVYFPLSTLPGWAQSIAVAFPPAHVFESMRAVLSGNPTPWGSLGVALMLDAAYLAAAMFFAYSMFRGLRRRGYITRYM